MEIPEEWKQYPLASDTTAANRPTGWYILNNKKLYWLPSKQWRAEWKSRNATIKSGGKIFDKTSEYWLPIPSMPKYGITLYGILFRIENSEIKNSTERKDGRHTFIIYSKSYLRYRLLLETFFPLSVKLNPSMQCDHDSSVNNEDSAYNITLALTAKINANNPNTRKKRQRSNKKRKAAVTRLTAQVHCFCGKIAKSEHNKQCHSTTTGLNHSGTEFSCLHNECDFKGKISTRENMISQDNIKIIEKKLYNSLSDAAADISGNSCNISTAITINGCYKGYFWIKTKTIKNLEEIENRKKHTRYEIFKKDYIVFSMGKSKVFSLKTYKYLIGDTSSGVRRYRPFNITEHKLIGTLFIPNPDNKPELDHKNQNTLDNDVTNLRWCTHKENMANPLTRKKMKDNPNCSRSIKIHYKNGKNAITPSIQQCAYLFNIRRYFVKKYIRNKTEFQNVKLIEYFLGS